MGRIALCVTALTTPPLQVSHVLEYAHDHQVEAFLEPTVDLCHALLQRDSVDVPRGVPGAGDTVQLVRNIISFVIFAGTLPSRVSESPFALVAARCATILAQVRPRRACAHDRASCCKHV